MDWLIPQLRGLFGRLIFFDWRMVAVDGGCFVWGGGLTSLLCMGLSEHSEVEHREGELIGSDDTRVISALSRCRG